MNNVATVIVPYQLCSGCGVCGGVCPVSAIKLRFNSAGEYNPEVSDECTNCGLCLTVCPFSEVSPNEDAIAARQYADLHGIKHTKQTGYYLDCFAGFSPEYRAGSASGGLLSYTLKRLFETGQIDRAVCVVPNADPKKLFKFTVVNSADHLAKAAGSAYYPVEMSEIVREIIKTPGNYAITGLPCFIKSIRNIASVNPVVKERVKFCLGLVCGQFKSKHYTEYLAHKAGLRECVKSVKFRGKDCNRPINDFFHEFIGVSGKEVRDYCTGAVGKVFTSRMFTLPVCSFCDDTFAECADAVFMDAWLPEYVKDSKGTSLVLVRNPKLLEIYGNAGDSVRRETIENLELSQAGVVNIKQTQLAYRLYVLKKSGKYVPRKRVKPSRKISLFNRKDTEIKEKIREQSRSLSEQLFNKTVPDIEKIDAELKSLFSSLAFWQKVHRIWRYSFGRWS